MKYALVAASALLLGACSITPDAPQHTADQGLQHHHWVLSAIDGVAVDPELGSELEIGEHFTLNGLAGCNRFFGKATFQQGVLKADGLGSTLMACTPEQQKVERAVLDTLTGGAIVHNQRPILKLVGDDYTLTYRLKDYM